ncbi:hypothetical protein [Campylobacter sp.]|nr:hypothetical protein [Campylobacter sp.]MDO4674754.1 hypothetical protein [Campylobacter sp.]
MRDGGGIFRARIFCGATAMAGVLLSAARGIFCERDFLARRTGPEWLKF